MGVGHLSQPQSLHQSLHPCSPCGRFAPPSHRPCLLRCRSSVVEHSLGKGEVDSSILSGSTSGNADESGTFGDFGRERSAIEKSRIVQNDPATSAISDTLVAHWNTFRSATACRPAVGAAGRHAVAERNVFQCATNVSLIADVAGSFWTILDFSIALRSRPKSPKVPDSSAFPLVLPDRIELSTSPLPRECSTTELRQRSRHGRCDGGANLPQGLQGCKDWCKDCGCDRCPTPMDQPSSKGRRWMNVRPRLPLPCRSSYQDR